MSQASVIAAYKRKLASNPEGELDFQTIEITHSLLTQRYLLVVGTTDLQAQLETGEPVTFEAIPMQAADGGNNNDMDQQASFTLPDIGNMLDDEMTRIPLDNDEPIIFTYRAYVSSDLTYPCRGPVRYELQSLNQSKGVFTADVGVPRLNQKGTGVLITPSEIPLLRGILAG